MQHSLFRQSFHPAASQKCRGWGPINPLSNKQVCYMKYQKDNVHLDMRGVPAPSVDSMVPCWTNWTHSWEWVYRISLLCNLSSRLLSSGSLVIISPSVDDTATYECMVTNDAGEDKRTMDLTVEGRIGLVCGLKVIIMISFPHHSTAWQESFPFTYLTSTFIVQRGRCVTELWKSLRAGNV